MSDTPRTDAKRSGPEHFMGDWVDANFACQLERELNAATSEIERLRKANLQLREGAEEQKQRIKRLEEAGDRLAGTTPPSSDRYMAWIKAREAKP